MNVRHSAICEAPATPAEYKIGLFSLTWCPHLSNLHEVAWKPAKSRSLALWLLNECVLMAAPKGEFETLIQGKTQARPPDWASRVVLLHLAEYQGVL